MKQYTTPDQTAKLIELGFEKPSSIASVEPIYGMGGISVAKAYTIGELIDFIPDTGSEAMRNRQIFGQGVRFYTGHCIYDFDEEPELIDNLFNLVVRLKEEEVI